ncbi:coiled-coil domain-containing protein 174-like isoform X1 [Biomphalaria glabrata]|nr:coiled-coil domain-containing protein 174-like isoform X1 [Biomphalaria glabrata]KAI8791877.1 coiled-coil domain-containing protein 174 isoform X1 [Biomphalaria glabrata]
MNKDDHPDITTVTVSSAIVELKAELFRKQEEFKQKKLNNETYLHLKRSKSLKSSLLDESNSGVLERAKKDVESRSPVDNEDDMLQKSRKILEEKAKLYDKISQSSVVPDEDGSEFYLVDFQKKVLDSMLEAKQNLERETTEKTKSSQPNTSKFNEQLSSKEEEESSLLVASEAFREKLREKWESEANELLQKSQNDIHYSNIQFDEIRNHGVGFFQFSKDHEQRESELASLKKLHKETIDEQARKDSIKAKRKTQMEERLAKVRQRRNLKDVKQDIDAKANTQLIISDSDSCKQPVSAELSTSKELDVPSVHQDVSTSEQTKKPIREWDRGKVFPVKSYVEERRKERESDFAPPDSYFTSTASKEDLRRKEKPGPQKFEQSFIDSTVHKKALNGRTFPTSCDSSSEQIFYDKRSVSNGEHFTDPSYCTQYYMSHTYGAYPQNAPVDYSYDNTPASVTNYQPHIYPAWPVATPISSTSLDSTAATYKSGYMQPKKPKLSLVDTRFVQNDSMASLPPSDTSLLEVNAVNYTPGSFTAAKLKQFNQTTEEISHMGNRNEISSAPVMYTLKQEENNSI